MTRVLVEHLKQFAVRYNSPGRPSRACFPGTSLLPGGMRCWFCVSGFLCVGFIAAHRRRLIFFHPYFEKQIAERTSETMLSGLTSTWVYSPRWPITQTSRS